MKDYEAAELVALIAATWPRPPMAEATQRVYERHLLSLEYDQAGAALDHLAATSKFLPSIAEIREAAVTTKVGHVRLGMEAWGDVVEAIRKHGVYPSLMPGAPKLEFADPIVAECVRVMGWRELCLSENDMADRSRFCDLYNGLAQRERVSEVTGRQLPEKAGGLKHGGQLELKGRAALDLLAGGIGRGGEKRQG
jgi:hypothetical protein